MQHTVTTEQSHYVMGDKSSTTQTTSTTTVTTSTSAAIDTAYIAPFKRAIFYYQWIVTVFIIILNLISIIVCVKSSNQALRKRANRFVLSLAAADIMLGALIPYGLLTFFDPAISVNLTYCKFRNAFLLAHCMGSVLSILLVTTDRYVAVIYPFYYYKTGGLPKGQLCIAAVWGYALFSALVMLFWNTGDRFSCSAFVLAFYANYYYILWALPFFAASIVMVFMYVHIFYTAAHQESHLHRIVFEDYQRTKRDRKYAKV